jgi:hypothetical protein
MNQMRTSGLCLVTVFAMSAAGVSVASAASPQFSGNSTLEASGPELVITIGAEGEKRERVKCALSTGHGALLTAKTGTLTLSLTQCSAARGLECHTAGAKAGEINTAELEFELGYINASEDRVGVAYKPVGGLAFAEFDCGEYKVVITGSVIGAITPINTVTTSQKLTFTQNQGGQNPRRLESGPVDVLNTSVSGEGDEDATIAEETTIETVASITTSQPEEIEAVKSAKGGGGGGEQNWKVNGVFLKPGDSREFTFETKANSEITAPEGGPTLVCGESSGAGTITGAKNAETVGTSTTTQMSFSRCSVVGEPECQVTEAAPAPKTKGHNDNRWFPPRISWVFGFAKLTFSVKECFREGTYVLSGSADSYGPSNEEITFPGPFPEGELLLDGHPATVALTYRLRLTGGGALEAGEMSPSPSPTTYLSLGDSLAFGYTRAKYEANFPTESPSAFEEGFDHFLAKKLRASSKKFETDLKGLVDINNGCPGETTDSMIGNGALGAAVDPEGDTPCPYHLLGFPLHHEYGMGQSQLENALQVLAENAGKVKNVTLDVGTNDVLEAERKCEKEVQEEFEQEGKSKYGATFEEAVNGCIGSHAEETFTHIANNLGTILFVLDNGSKFGGVDYTGPIEVLGFYNPFTFLLPGSDNLWAALNSVIETKVVGKFPNAVYANPFPRINPNTTHEEEKVCKYTEMCAETGKANNPNGDRHPTKAGYELLATLLFKVYNPAL